MLARKLGQGLLALSCVAIASLLADAGDAKKTDPSGDALPEGAIARMGTLRWRHGEPVTFVAFPSDKTVLTAAQDNTIRLWDRATGKEIRRFSANANVKVPQPAGVVPLRFNPYGMQSPRMALSGDGKLLAAVLPTNAIQLWEVETGKELRQFPALRNGANTLLFSPDAKMLAVRGNDRTTTLLDAESGKELRQLKGGQAGIRFAAVAGGNSGEAMGFAFSPDGKTIAVAELDIAMQKLTTLVRLSETDTAKEIRQIDTTPTGVSAVAYSPDGKVLAFSSENTIHLREADSGKEIRKIEAGAATAMLTFAPDSRTIAVKGRDQVVRLFVTETGKRTHELGQTGTAVFVNPNLRFNPYYAVDVRDVAFSPDSKVLAIGGGQSPRFFDVGTGKQTAQSGGHSGAVTAVVVSADGKTLITRGADNMIRRWQAGTGEELGQFAEPRGTMSVRFAPDGATIAMANSDGTIHLYNAVTGKELHQTPKLTGGATALAYSPDSKMVAARGVDNTIRLFNVAQGTEVKQLTLQPANANPNAALVRYAGDPSGPIAFAADGQTVAAVVAGQNNFGAGGGVRPVGNITNHLRIWDITTGKEIRQIELPAQRGVNHIAFSPDGRILATENTDQTVSLWELASGKERGVLASAGLAGQPAQPVIVAGGGFIGMPQQAPPRGVTLAYSLDGAFIATRGPNNTVRVWDVDHAKEVATFKGHDGAIVSLAFASNGKSLASGSADTTALVWDLSRIKREVPPAAELTQQAILGLWTDLQSDDAGKAGRAILTLASAPKQTLPLLKEHVKPAAAPEVAKIDQWIRDLDSSNFPKRTNAIQELEKLGELAIPALKKVLTTSVALETRRRVEPLLEKLTTGSLNAEQVRLVRAIEVLDKIGNAEAQQTLESLARGAPGALTTRHAQHVLERAKWVQR